MYSCSSHCSTSTGSKVSGAVQGTSAPSCDVNAYELLTPPPHHSAHRRRGRPPTLRIRPPGLSKYSTPAVTRSSAVRRRAPRGIGGVLWRASTLMATALPRSSTLATSLPVAAKAMRVSTSATRGPLRVGLTSQKQMPSRVHKPTSAPSSERIGMSTTSLAATAISIAMPWPSRPAMATGRWRIICAPPRPTCLPRRTVVAGRTRRGGS